MAVTIYAHYDSTKVVYHNPDLNSLSKADLSWVNLSGANLSKADLSGVNLKWVNLSGADLSEVTGTEKQPASLRILPDKGDIIGYKKLDRGIIAKLLIPGDALRSNATGRKCRASKAIVLSLSGNATIGYSQYDSEFTYVVGNTVTPEEPFDTKWFNECTSGIHFFITREEAEDY